MAPTAITEPKPANHVEPDLKSKVLKNDIPTQEIDADDNDDGDDEVADDGVPGGGYKIFVLRMCFFSNSALSQRRSKEEEEKEETQEKESRAVRSPASGIVQAFPKWNLPRRRASTL